MQSSRPMGFNKPDKYTRGENVVSHRNQSVARVERHLAKAEALSQVNNCGLLSSHCQYNALLCLDARQFVQEFTFLSPSKEHGASLDSGRVVSVFDGSNISPMEEASLVLHGTNEGDSKEDLDEEEIVSWLLDSVKKEESCHNVWCSECGESSCESSLYDGSSTFDSSSTSFRTNDGTPSYVRDINFSDLSSLFDLEKEDSELLPDTQHRYGFSEDAELPSPYKSDRTQEYRTPISSCETPCRADIDADDPLYWPLDQNSYCSPEFDNFLSISPPRGTSYIEFLGTSNSNSSKWRFQQKRDHPKSSKIDKEGCRRRISFSSTPISGNLKREKHLSSSVSGINKSSDKSSGLTRSSTRAFPKYYPSTKNMKERHHHKLNINKRHDNADTIQPSQKLEVGDHFQDFIIDGAPIEKLIGLNEFIGNEGIDFDLDEVEFSLILSP
ncbi:uncharacterized protein LOC120262156 [Dioscorea cayenensis subsp. rotundata]|uniref:Uncharacterized protein LOC120262156 n=1 Tax=Dioscorea cayennensis subsp. rotundata TaxID=55577 RepID=A0AB40BFP3_DIOCR|nr:uncharacterized protein LOC120262156 [Dioscorea cayenensis subsp. rotundata]